MRESIANSYIFMLVLIFFAICIVLMFGMLNYSKTFKIRNRMIEIIEYHRGFRNEGPPCAADVVPGTDMSCSNVRQIHQEFTDFLRTAGYSNVGGRRGQQWINCPDLIRGDELTEGITAMDLGERNFRYCIYEHMTVKGPYYTVTVFMSFDIPIIGSFMRFDFPINGTTRVIYSLEPPATD